MPESQSIRRRGDSNDGSLDWFQIEEVNGVPSLIIDEEKASKILGVKQIVLKRPPTGN